MITLDLSSNSYSTQPESALVEPHSESGLVAEEAPARSGLSCDQLLLVGGGVGAVIIC